MRLGGPFPFPITAPAVNGAGEAVALTSGQMFIVPQGNWLVIPGQETVLEYFDQVSGLWRGTQCYQGQVEQISSDGANYRLVNLSGVVVGANITNVGSGGTNGIGPLQTGSTVSFGAPAAGGAQATAQGYVVVGGTVPAPTVTQGGSGFIHPPLVFCDPPPPGGVQALFTATISSAGVITGVTQVNAGAGYTSIPNFYIVPQPQYYQGEPRWPAVAGGSPDTSVAQGLSFTGQPPGLINPANAWGGFPYQGNLVTGTTGALLTGAALTGSGTLTAIIVNSYGQGYTGSTLPAVSFAGVSLGAAAATSIMSFCSTVAPGSTLTGQTGATYVVGNIAETTLGLVSNTNNNNLFTPRPIRGKVTNATGPAITVEDPGFGIQSAGTGVTIGPSGGTLGNVAAANLGGLTDVSVLQYLGASG